MQEKLYVGPLSDNRRWRHVPLRPSDSVVVTPPKCGTTWMQTIVSLVMSGDPDVETELSVKMPWIDLRVREIEDVAARVDAIEHRRSFKSHTPMDGIPYNENVQYFCVFRHPLDAHFSYRTHVRNIPMTWFELFYPEGDEDTMFKRFLDGAAEGFDMDAMPLAHILQHFKAAHALTNKPNVTLFHYADMTRDLAGTFEKVATLLKIKHPPSLMAELVQVATFDHMKANAERYAPSGGKGFMKSDSDFFYEGKIGKWMGKLSAAQLEGYNIVMETHLSPQERRWLEEGSQ